MVEYKTDECRARRMLQAGLRRYWIVTLLLVVVVSSCNAGHGLVVMAPTEVNLAPTAGLIVAAPKSHVPDVVEMEQIVRNQLISMGEDPDRQVAKVPGAGNSVIDLEWIPYDPDGSGPLAQTGFQLSWTDRLVGDYDQNGEVNLSDITPMAIHWGSTVVYELPQLHEGIQGYPLGDPDYDGDVQPGDPPLVNSGASNWRLARIDGDSNSEINLAELTPLSLHYGERFDGYRIYRRNSPVDDYVAIEDPLDPGQPLLLSRMSASNPGGADPFRPVRYTFVDESEEELGEWSYYVVPFDSTTGLEGPRSGEDNKPLSARLVADVTQGATPLTVNLDASDSTTSSGSITAYRWDLNGDGLIDEDTGFNPTTQKIFSLSGAWLVSVEVTNSEGDTDIASLMVSVTNPPLARLTALPTHREVPVTLTIDAGSSLDPDGEVTGFEWDMDNDGLYELDTGPVSQRIIEYTEPGTYSIGVRVRDNLNATDETILEFELVDEFDEVEDNDSPMSAMQLGSFQQSDVYGPLSGGIGPGNYDGDEADWFMFEVDAGVGLLAELNFTHDDADLDLELLRNNGTQVWASSTSQSNDEVIDARLPRAEPYFLKVSRADGSAGGSALYTLALTFVELVYDELEDNDSALTAQDLGDCSASPVRDFWGSLGPGGLDGDDDDWFEFTISQAANYQVALTFFHEDADLELQVFEAGSMNLIGTSQTVSDRESVQLALEPGTFLARCFRFDGGHSNYQLEIMFGE